MRRVLERRCDGSLVLSSSFSATQLCRIGAPRSPNVCTPSLSKSMNVGLVMGLSLWGPAIRFATARSIDESIGPIGS
jgi:hypothetical protein